MKALHLVFIDNRDQVFWIKETDFYDPQMTLLALTADALQSLEELHYPCCSISDITDTYPLVQAEEQYIKDIVGLAKEIETYIGQRYPPAQFEGPGFLSGNYYTLQYSISAIAKRAFLMREAIRFFSPDLVTAFQEEVNEWFVDDGYNKNPWDNILEFFSEEYIFPINFIRISTEKRTQSLRLYRNRFFDYIPIIMKKIINSCFIFSKKVTLPGEYNGLSVLFVNSIGYDWGPVLKLFKSNKKIKSFKLEQITLKKNQWWSTICGSSIEQLFSSDKCELSIESPVFHTQESKDLELLFEQWLKERQESPKILVLEMNLFPFLIPQIKTMIIQGPEIIRYSDKLAKLILKKVHPHIACFSIVTLLYERRFVFQCEKLGIPTIVYTHGFGDNLWIQPKNEGLDQACVDYVLQYGEGISPRSNAIFPIKAKFISVGSARIEQMIQNKKLFFPRMDKKLKILWIADTTTKNTYFASLTEDTKRYKLQKECLNLLSKNEKNHVIYRPLIFQISYDGTSMWINNENNPSMLIDPYTPLQDLIVKSDVVILDITSPTTWGRGNRHE